MKKQLEHYQHEKDIIFYRQVIAEIYNIAIQKTLNWTRNKRRWNKVNGYEDFILYIENSYNESEWEKYYQLFDSNLNNMGISNEIKTYIKSLKKDGNCIAHPDLYQYTDGEINNYRSTTDHMINKLIDIYQKFKY